MTGEKEGTMQTSVAWAGAAGNRSKQRDSASPRKKQSWHVTRSVP